MKKKSLTELLRVLDNLKNDQSSNVSNLNEKVSKKLLRGGYETTNMSCSGGRNASCQNYLCQGGFDGSCWNFTC